jgi:hypothetical protein
VVADMHNRAKALEGSAPSDAVACVELAHGLVTGLAATNRMIRSTDPEMRRRLTALHDTAAVAVGQAMDDARDAVTGVVETGGSAPLADQVVAEKNLLALRKCQGFAPVIGLGPKLERTLQGVAKEVRFKALDALDALRVQPGASTALETEFYWNIRMLELAGASEEAERLRKDLFALRQPPES